MKNFISFSTLFQLFFITFLNSENAQAQATSYFQQRVDTKIEVTLDDTANKLYGFEELDYQNNSPDTLRFIYFHLWPNAFKNDRTAYTKQAVENFNSTFYYAKHKNRGYIDSLAFEVNGQKAGMILTDNIDIVKVMLPQPLLPKEKITITTPFTVKIPYCFSRLGYKGQSYQISQWFPKPAVYDNRGWHPMPYLDQGEFYSEYGSYDVKITVPQNYIVMATGNLQNKEEQDWLDALSRLDLPTDTLYENSTPTSSSSMKTLHFKEDNIHDFAWFADKRWVVRKGNVIVPETGLDVTTWVAFLPKDQKGWAKGLESLSQTVTELSKQVGPYPYKTIKAVEGGLEAGGGMEYPTVTVIAPYNDVETNHTVIVHEAGHNWFYGILGSNERLNPWQDEGINSFYEKMITKIGLDTLSDKAHSKTSTQDISKNVGVKKSGLNLSLDAFSNLTFTYPMSVHTDMASGWRADTFTNICYGGDVYGKTPFLLSWLRDYMRAEDFEKAMKDYFNKWKFKHPYPEDFEAVFKQNTPKDINWFFELLYSDKPIDFALKNVHNQNGVWATVVNNTGIKAPVKINMISKESNDTTTLISEPFLHQTTLNLSKTNGFKKVWIDNNIPDYKQHNNTSNRGISIKPFLGLNNSDRVKMWIAPSLGYNVYDGFMLGALLHNISIPQNKFQYILAPMYAFGSKALVGTGRIGYTAYTSNSSWLHNLQINVEGKSFSYLKTDLNISKPIRARYMKVAPELIFTLNKPYARASVEDKFSLKAYWIAEQNFNFNQDPNDSLFRPSKGDYSNQYYARLYYNHDNYRMFNPFSYHFEMQAGKDFAKLSAELNMKVDYFLKGKGIYFRVYGGKFFNLASNEFQASRFWLTTTYTGVNDYLYDGTYFGRNESMQFASQQVANKEGGFASRTQLYSRPLGLSNNWLFALNVKTDLPLGWLPLRLYANVATFTDAQKTNPSGAKALFETGVELYIDKYVSVMLPIFVSKDFNEYSKSILGKNAYLKRISFTINFENLDWFNLPKMLLKKM